MNGVSHMLPFVIGGGILIALSFLEMPETPEQILFTVTGPHSGRHSLKYSRKYILWNDVPGTCGIYRNGDRRQTRH